MIPVKGYLKFLFIEPLRLYLFQEKLRDDSLKRIFQRHSKGRLGTRHAKNINPSASVVIHVKSVCDYLLVKDPFWAPNI